MEERPPCIKALVEIQKVNIEQSNTVYTKRALMFLTVSSKESSLCLSVWDLLVENKIFCC